jgi:hypothetical protein
VNAGPLKKHKSTKDWPPAKLIHGESGDEHADRCLAFNIGAGESIESPPFAQNAKDGPPATRGMLKLQKD